MAHFIIEVPVGIYDAVRELQERILNYEVEADQARDEMNDLIGPYCTQLPTEHDTTTIQLRKSLLVSTTPHLRPN